MNKKTKFFAIACAIIVIVGAIVVFGRINTPDNAKSQYFCDNNIWTVALNVDVNNMDKQELYHISGEFFGKYEDNLAMTDLGKSLVREMTDDYNLITQNDHVILDNNGILYICEGNFTWVGNSYNVYSNAKEQVATIEFNVTGTSGAIRDMNGEVVAQYDSSILFSDYVVSIFDGCAIDDESVLMMFASCFSDIRADNN